MAKPFVFVSSRHCIEILGGREQLGGFGRFAAWPATVLSLLSFQQQTTLPTSNLTNLQHHQPGSNPQKINRNRYLYFGLFGLIFRTLLAQLSLNSALKTLNLAEIIL